MASERSAPAICYQLFAIGNKLISFTLLGPCPCLLQPPASPQPVSFSTQADRPGSSHGCSRPPESSDNSFHIDQPARPQTPAYPPRALPGSHHPSLSPS